MVTLLGSFPSFLVFFPLLIHIVAYNINYYTFESNNCIRSVLCSLNFESLLLPVHCWSRHSALQSTVSHSVVHYNTPSPLRDSVAPLANQIPFEFFIAIILSHFFVVFSIVWYLLETSEISWFFLHWKVSLFNVSLSVFLYHWQIKFKVFYFCIRSIFFCKGNSC